jgi:hypothetical protein
MRIKLALLALCSLPMFAADNPYIGTWKLNTAKSTYKPGPPMKELTVKFEADGNNVRRIAQGVDGEGKPVDEGGTEGTSFPWDGEFHTVTKPSAKPEVQVEVKIIDPHHLAVRIKVDGKITDNDRSSVSADGKTITDVDSGVNMKGEKYHNVEVFEKQ